MRPMVLRADRVPWMLSVVLFLIAAVRWVNAQPERTIGSAISPVGEGERIRDTAMPETADLLAARNPFRLSRRPGLSADDATVASESATPEVVVAPVYVVKGIVGGPPWLAVMDGLPGQPAGTVVRAGSTYENLRIRSVTRDTVVLEVDDRTIRLAMIRTPQ